ncbi:MAG: oxaloacetate decarboxylase subunit alpha [Clostridiales bacterium]|nr:oxaloacetate decarboxylase subunit alpha [Clostridiales bacterium]
MKNKVKICDCTLRDGQQSLIATRLSTAEMLPIIGEMDKVGFGAMEVWGGATYDSCLRYLKEDPWDRLRAIRKAAPNTKLQMLLRGQNILGYRHYADDVVEMFVKKSIENGIDIIRIFDALNDVRNLETAVKACKKAGGHAQLAISFTLSDVHTEEYFVDLAKKFANIGADSICIKDMAGLLLPSAAYDLVKAIKKKVDLPLEIHSHYTSGAASMTYLKAIEAGADIIDTDMSPFSMGTSQPSTEVMNAVLKGTKYDTGLDEHLLKSISDYFLPIREKALESGLLSTKVLSVDIATLIYQVPGGMLSNLVSQLKTAGAEDKYREVLEEIPRVRADLGYPPLVTPSSQIVGTQAVLNVIMGERYKMTPKETKDLVRGMYGRTPVPISKEIREKIIGDEEPVTCRPADLLKPELPAAEKAIKDFKEQDEDVLSYVLFPQVAQDYFKFRQAQKYDIDPDLAKVEEGVYPI